MAKLTSKERDDLPAAAFGIPSKRKFPLDTKARARNALARASADGTPAEKAAVRKKVARLYPDVAQSKGPQARKTGRRKKTS